MSFVYSHRERCGSCERCRRFAFLCFPMAFFYYKLHFVHKNYPKQRETIQKGRPRKHLKGGKNTKHAKTTLHCWKSIGNCLSTGVRSQNTNTRATKMTRDDGTNRFQPVAATRLENLTVFFCPPPAWCPVPRSRHAGYGTRNMCSVIIKQFHCLVLSLPFERLPDTGGFNRRQSTEVCGPSNRYVTLRNKRGDRFTYCSSLWL